jgi:predicted DNA-binding transcriptional regulator YafY
LRSARQIADALEVSVRTIYRDMADLQGCGVPIEGEPGVGYALRAGFHLPPLMFTRQETAALVMGARMVAAFGGQRLGRAAQEALVKIESVLPEAERRHALDTSLHALGFHLDDETRVRIDRFDTWIRERRTVKIRYQSLESALSERDVRPLGLYFWGSVWTLLAWCELRGDFRTFRVDRLNEATALDRIFAIEPGKTLQDYLDRICEEHPHAGRSSVRDSAP